MANAILYITKSGRITHFIENCKVVGKNFFGSNCKLSGVSPHKFSVLWTEEVIECKDGVWNKELSDITSSKEFNSVVVSNREDVNNVTKNRIKEKYSIEEEIKLQREKLLGIESDEWGSYISYVSSVVNKGREFKDEHFIEHTIDEEPVLDYDALYYPNLKKENN